MADSYILVAMLTAAVSVITQLMLLPTPPCAGGNHNHI